MARKEHAYEPLDHISNSSDEIPETVDHTLQLSRHRGWGANSRVIAIFTVVLLVSNGIWAWLLVEHRKGGESVIESDFFDTSLPFVRTFHWNTPFSDDNKTVSSPLWSGLFPDGAGLVTVEKSWAVTQNLPISKEDPADSDKMVYFVAALHQTHCLTVIRASLYHFNEGKEQTVPWKHVTHCLDSLRQLVTCKMDSTLLYTEDANVFGDGQAHTCGDWNALTAWASKHAFVQKL